MMPLPMTPLQGDQGVGSSLAGMPFSSIGLPFGLFPPMNAMSSNAMVHQNQTEVANLTALYATFRNMTVAEFATTIQTVLMTSLMRQYLFNDFFAGGLGLMLVGLLGTWLKMLFSRFANWLTTTKGPVQMRVPHDSEVYTWMQDWLQQFSIISSTSYDVSCVWGDNSNECDGDPADDRPKVKLLPEFKNAQKVIYKNSPVWIQSSKQMSNWGGGGGGGDDDILKLLKAAGTKDDLIISAGSKKLLEEAVHDAMEAYFKKEEESRTTKVYRWSCDEMYWVNIGSRKIRPIDSVILDCDPTFLLEDAKKFLSSEAWYADRGIPHRRGYLLHGPPGCGKTSLIKALAGELKLDVALISLSSKDLSDDLLQNAMNRLPYKSIFVLEDVDAAFRKEADVTHSGNASDSAVAARQGMTKNNLSFSGLLNAIDGITAQEGNIVVMTTNHIDRLDPALIRPGRIDLRFYLGLASTAQACGIFRRFYPDATTKDEAMVAATVPAGVLSPASLQGLFLEHRDDLRGMMEKLSAFVAEAKKENKEEGKGGDGHRDNGGEAQGESQGEGRRKKERKNKRSKDRRRETAALVTEQGEIAKDGTEVVQLNKEKVPASAGVAESETQKEASASSSEKDEEEGWETVTKATKKSSK